MVAITAAASAAISVVEALKDLNDLIGSQDPLLIRTINNSRSIPIKFGTIRDLCNIEAHAMPSPWIRAGSYEDANFGASSWDSASLRVEYWFDYDGKIYNLYLNYNWVSKHEANYTLNLVGNEGGETPLKPINEIKGDAYRTSTLNGPGFDFHILASGKAINIVLTQQEE